MSVSVLMISPGYPGEMPSFTTALGRVGATVYGLGDQPMGMLPQSVRDVLADYLQVSDLWDEATVIAEVKAWLGERALDRVECLWEPGVVLAATLRESFGCAGLDRERAMTFRNKELMKQVLDKAGIRTPRHRSAVGEDQIREAAFEVGYPLIIKPVAGAGSANTYRVHSNDELENIAASGETLGEVSVEEFIDGEEFTFDTVAIDGKPAYFNVAWYRPRPLIARTNEWISPQVVSLRDVDKPHLAAGVEMGHKVLEAMGFERGFTHMEWYLKADGEVVFGEIAARPPGAHQVDQMNFSCDFDIFLGWAEAICNGEFTQTVDRKYNVANIYKRAEGQGRIVAIHELERLREDWGKHIVWENLLPIGARRRNWLQTLVSDGFLVVRHPELDRCLEIADDVCTNLRLYARS